jgi:hypothetical protein
MLREIDEEDEDPEGRGLLRKVDWTARADLRPAGSDPGEGTPRFWPAYGGDLTDCQSCETS